jgi:hypothetical protein
MALAPSEAEVSVERSWRRRRPRRRRCRRSPNSLAPEYASAAPHHRHIDPIDLAYNRFDRVPKPTTQAVSSA